MGKVRTRQIKTFAKEIYEDYSDKIAADFDTNKEVLQEFNIGSKRLRNRIAGYLVKLKKKET